MLNLTTLSNRFVPGVVIVHTNYNSKTKRIDRRLTVKEVFVKFISGFFFHMLNTLRSRLRSLPMEVTMGVTGMTVTDDRLDPV